MKALILNSGIGSRMGVLTSEHPKCMSELYPGETILSRQLKQIVDFGISEVIITTGYFDAILVDYCKSLDLPLEYTFVKNERYIETNYIYSIYCARDFIEDDRLDEIYGKFAPTQYRFYDDMLRNKVKFADRIDSARSEVGFTDSKTRQFSDTIEGVPHWKIRVFDYDKTFPLESIEFEGYKFKCPKDCDHHLTSMFGPDYMEFPKVIENHNTLELIEAQFASTEEMDNAFEGAIELFKNINKTF